MSNQTDIAKGMFKAFAAGDRKFAEEHLADDLLFSSPPDPHLDLAGYFEKCWPGAGKGMNFEFVRCIESGDEVVITYAAKQADGAKGMNAEVYTFSGDKIKRIEVYFGWTEQ
jgi:hypothetical protein